MKKSCRYHVEALDFSEQKNITGGAPHWLIPVAVAALYSEINDIWESGGENIKDAWESGYNSGYGK